MSHAANAPIDSAKARTLTKYWHVLASSLLCAMSVGIARGKYGGVEGRVDAVEQTHPDATASTTARNTAELAALNVRVDRMSQDVAATRMDVARLCLRFELQPTRGAESTADGLSDH